MNEHAACACVQNACLARGLERVVAHPEVAAVDEVRVEGGVDGNERPVRQTTVVCAQPDGQHRVAVHSRHH